MTKGKIKIKRKGVHEASHARGVNDSKTNALPVKGKIKSSTRRLVLLALFSLTILIASAVLLLQGDQILEPDRVNDTGEEEQVLENQPRLITHDYHRIGSDDGLAGALYQLGINDQSLGIDVNTITRLTQKLSREISPDHVNGGLVTLYLDRSRPGHRRIGFLPDPEIYEVWVGFGDTSYVLKMDRELKVKRQKKSHLVTYDNLYYSLMKDGFSPEFVQGMEETLEYTVDLHHVRAKSKAKLRTIYQESYADEQLISVDIHAIEFYQSGNIDRLYRFNNGAYYDADGYSAQRQFLRAPVKYTRVSSPFGLRRNPVSGNVQQHNGIDFAAPEGTPIRALSHGTIEKVDFTLNNGYYVKIKHDGTYQTQYLHMSGFAEDAKPGKQIRQGEIIGYVGSTGKSTGPHVCLRFWKHGKQVDFFKEKMPHLERLSGNAYEAFEILRDSLDKQMTKITL